MRMSIRKNIFLPVVIILLLLPIASYLTFNITSSIFMEREAKQDLIMLLKSVEPLVEYTFKKKKGHSTSNEEQQIIDKQLQMANFFGEVKPILQNGLNETQILLLDKNYELIYPIGGIFEKNSLSIYEACMAQGKELIARETFYRQTIEDREYLIGSINKENNHHTPVKYIVGYSAIPDINKLLSRISVLVFIITGIIAVIILPFIWALANRISNPIKSLCIQAKNIGENNFTHNREESSLEEILQLNRAMNEMASRLGCYDRGQKVFFENVSHELRTPLMSIRGYAEGIECGIFENTKVPIEVIIKESDKLASLVNSLLTLSRIDNAKQDIELQLIDIRAFLKGRISAFLPLAQSKNIDIILELQEMKVLADEYLLESIVDNIFSNCLRYATSQIIIQKIPNGFLIEDDGSGFEEEDLLYLFNRFYKGKEGQTGLGLAIAKSSIEYMGGSINAYNGINGAVFEITFNK